MCHARKKRDKNNCSSIKIELFFSGLMFPYWDRNVFVFAFFLDLRTTFLMTGQIAFLSATWAPIRLDPFPSGHLTLIKNHLRCPQCLIPPPNSNNFLLLFFSWSSLVFFRSLPLYFTLCGFPIWLLIWESDSGFIVSNKYYCIYQLITLQSLQPQVVWDFLSLLIWGKEFFNVSTASI